MNPEQEDIHPHYGDTRYGQNSPIGSVKEQ